MSDEKSISDDMDNFRGRIRSLLKMRTPDHHGNTPGDGDRKKDKSGGGSSSGSSDDSGTDADIEVEGRRKWTEDRRVKKIFRKRMKKHAAYARGLERDALHYYDDIEPAWFLVEGPFVVFPRKVLERDLQLHDLVEYYRAYPNLQWSLYPNLLQAILGELSAQDRDILRSHEQVHLKHKQAHAERPSGEHGTVPVDTAHARDDQNWSRAMERNELHRRVNSGDTSSSMRRMHFARVKQKRQHQNEKKRKKSILSSVWRLFVQWTQFDDFNHRVMTRLWRMLSWIFSLWWLRIAWVRLVAMTSDFVSYPSSSSRAPHGRNKPQT